MTDNSSMSFNLKMELHFYIILKNSNQFQQKTKHGNMLRDHLVPNQTATHTWTRSDKNWY